MGTFLKRVLCVLGLGLILAFPAFAHPGRTDASGGHHDYNNTSGLGGYHYHHGYPAHLHPNGTCLYDFDDRTGRSSGGPSGGRATATPAPSVATPAAAGPAVGSRWSIPLILGGAAAWGLWSLSRSACKKYRERRTFDAERARYTALYGGKTIQELARMAGMPEGVALGPDGLPKEAGADGWGERFTYYVASSGKEFHSVRGCGRSAVGPVNAASLGGRRPCSRCRAAYPDLSWYREYQRIRAIMSKYGVRPMDASFLCGTALRRVQEEALKEEAEASGLTAEQYKALQKHLQEEKRHNNVDS